MTLSRKDLSNRSHTYCKHAFEVGQSAIEIEPSSTSIERA